MKKQLDQRQKTIRVIAAFGIAFLAVGVYYLISADHTCLFLLPAIMMAACVYYAKDNLPENSFFVCFLACFFTFLLGRRIIYRITGNTSTDFSVRIERGTDIKLLAGLFGLLCGYILVDWRAARNKEKFRNILLVSEVKAVEIKTISKILFYCTFPFWIYTMLDVTLFVWQNGYAEYYRSYFSSVPALIRVIGKAAPLFFFVFLAMMPRKREAMVPIILYLLYAAASLSTGRRLTFITSLIIIFGYCLARNRRPESNVPWISKKIIYAMCVGVPVLLMIMYLFEYIRGDAAVGNAADNNPLLGFFIRQGVSVNVIKYAEMYANKMNAGSCYSLYSTLKWLSDSLVVKVMGIDIPFVFGRQSEEVALYGTSLAHFVSYYADQESYLAGMGYGSCYIAELFADFGYFGVLIGNLIYGALICLAFKHAPSGGCSWVYAMGLYVANSLLVAPRASYDELFVKLLYAECWLPLALLLLLAYNKKANVFAMSAIEKLQRALSKFKWRD